MENNLDNLGKVLRELRQKRDLKIYQAANGVGVTPSFIGMIESGKRKPHLDLLCSIANFYDVPLATIFHMNEHS